MPASRRALTLGERFHRNIDDLSRRTSAGAARRFNPPAEVNLGAYFDEFIPVAGGLVGAGQGAAATLAGGYFRGLAFAELGEAEIAPTMQGNAGFTADGRALEEALAATRAKCLLGLSRGWKLDQARSFARASIDRFSRTEVVDASSLELTHQMQAHDAVLGWRWRSRGTCGACYALDDGSVRPADRVMERHPNCVCIPEPAFDVEETVQRRTGRQRFDDLPFKDQNRLLGTEKAELLRGGLIEWRDLVHRDQHREWTDSLTERSLRDLLAIAGLEPQT